MGLVDISFDIFSDTPKGEKHRPFAKKEAKIMLIEPRGVVNTGNIESKITAPSDQWI